MKILERRIAYAHWKDLNISFSYNIDQGVKLKKSEKIVISGKILDALEDKDVGKLLQKLSLVIRGKDEPIEKTSIISVRDPGGPRSNYL